MIYVSNFANVNEANALFTASNILHLHYFIRGVVGVIYLIQNYSILSKTWLTVDVSVVRNYTIMKSCTI